MGEWTTEEIKELLIDELGLDPLMVDAWLAAHDAEVARAAAEKAWDEGRSAAVNSHPSWWPTLTNPYRNPEPQEPRLCGHQTGLGDICQKVAPHPGEDHAGNGFEWKDRNG